MTHPDPKISGNTNMPGPHHHQYDRDGYPIPPGNTNASTAQGGYDPNYFPPPPRSETGIYEDAAGYPSAERGYNQTERGSVSDAGGGGGGGAAQLTPYDEEKAYAEYTNAYGHPNYGPQRAHPPPPPMSDYTAPRPRRRSDWDREDEEEERRRYEESMRRRHASPPPSTSAAYDSEENLSTRTSRPPSASSVSRRRSSDKKLSRKDAFLQGSGDRGFGATLLGGAAGAFLGDHIGDKKKGDKTFLKTIGGALVGAIGANAIERQVDKREREKQRREREVYYGRNDSYDDLYRGARDPSPFRPRRDSRRSLSRSRRGSFESDYRTEYTR
ncbi:hypothetical protein D0862_10681 [Hortaea werneckii]|uniref:Glycine zipper 2TM domain-containing protein n=1 Tax=Hortaea werneckii TaxID=91943 RepID=A0A3M7FF10_HORWE|nr:hypothetical protein D0862_10681 [Hortaea werneckii]